MLQAGAGYIRDLAGRAWVQWRSVKALIPPALLAYCMASSIATSFSWVIRPLFLYSLGYSGFEFGVLGGVTVAASTIASIAGGWYIDRYRAKDLVYLTTVSTSVSILLFATGNTILIIASAVLTGLTGFIGWNALQVLVSRVSCERKYEHAYSYMWSLTLIGNSIGAFMGWAPGIAIESIGLPELEVYRWSLVASAAGALAPAALLQRVPEEAPASGRGRRRLSLVEELQSWRALPWGLVSRFVAVEAMIGFGAAMSIHNISYYFIMKYGVGAGELGTMWGLNDLIMGVLAVFLPKASRVAGGALRLFIILSGASIPLLIAMTLVSDYAIAVAIYLARTVLMNMTNPVYSAFMMKVLPREYRGRCLSVISVARSTSSAIARPVGGYLLDIDVEAPLRLTSAIYTVALVVLSILFREHVVGSRRSGLKEG